VFDDIKIFFVKNHPQLLWTWVTIFYIYKMKPNVWWVTNYHICVRWKKKIFCFSVMTMNMSDHLLYIRGNQMCDGSPTITYVWDGRKNFLFLRDHEHEWPSIIYIRWDLMCDGSPTIMNVWDGRKNFFDSPWPWTWVTIFYIYKRKPNVWWVTNYHECVRWKKKFFWFSMTNTNVCCVSLVCVWWHKNIFCKESPPVMVMWRFWFVR